MTINFAGETWTLPPRGRFGRAMQDTLQVILGSKKGIALYAAMGLRGKAKRYEGKYRRAFIRFAEENEDKLEAGKVGPKGGWGYKYIGEEK